MARPGVLVIHNRYLEPGGEDSAVNAEIALLRARGHRVLQYARHNSEIAQFSKARKALLPFTTTWDYESYGELRSLIRQERPAIAHCHNLFPLLSPAVYYACASEGIPVVQTLHNYRLVCPGGNFFHDGGPCISCHGSLSRATLRGCYRDSRLQTGMVAVMLSAHRALSTWQKKVATYIAPSEFCCALAIQHGLPANKIVVKPHFASDVLPQKHSLGDYAIFVGRLSEEKGILQLLDVWRDLAHIPLLIVGSGPLEQNARQFAQASRLGNITFAGQLPHDETLQRIRSARFLVAPSRCYETFGISVLEAMACGVPAIVPRTGALHELVSDRRTGFHVDVDNREQFSAAIRRAWSHPLATREMGRAARHRCLEHYSPDNNYQQLTAIYDAALGVREPVRRVPTIQLGYPERTPSAVEEEPGNLQIAPPPPTTPVASFTAD
jgi:glycosyltransferase involved in cell wall biosynthesis